MERHIHPPENLQSDPRWHLVQRVVASPGFARSARLSEFLLYSARLTLLGESSRLNEQDIGVKVFGRPPGYLQAEDNIVRSNASRLRQRLDEYFAGEGVTENLRIRLPKGCYVPEFIQGPVLDEAGEMTTEPLPAEGVSTLKSRPSRFLILGLAATAVTLALVMVIWLRQDSHLNQTARASAGWSPSSALWNSMFDGKSPTLVVPADSSLVLYETLTRHQVALADYINGNYRTRSDDGKDDLTSPKGLAQRRLTSMADLDFVAAISRQPAVHGAINVRYARDLEMQDIKGSSLILLGGRESNPWGTLFDDERQFLLTSDPSTHVSTIHNLHPGSGQFRLIDCDPIDSRHPAYALVAYIPTHSDNHHVLLLEGTSIAGTEAATDFILDSATLDAILGAHMKGGQAVPSFDLVLELNDFSGTAPRARVIASRFWNY